MPESQPKFAELMRRVEEGSEEAVREVVETYGPHILRVVRRRLHKKLRSRFDSLDFVQDVWASFFAAMDNQRSFNEPEALIAFLTRVATNKVIDVFRRRFLTKRHNARGERSLNGLILSSPEELWCDQPTPSQVASAKEQWEDLLKNESPVDQRILTLLREGYTAREVAREVGLTTRTIRRLIHKLASRAAP